MEAVERVFPPANYRRKAITSIPLRIARFRFTYRRLLKKHEHYSAQCSTTIPLNQNTDHLSYSPSKAVVEYFFILNVLPSSCLFFNAVSSILFCGWHSPSCLLRQFIRPTISCRNKKWLSYLEQPFLIIYILVDYYLRIQITNIKNHSFIYFPNLFVLIFYFLKYSFQ